jgi:hypothetical protein
MGILDFEYTEIHFLSISEFPLWSATAMDEYKVDIRREQEEGDTLSLAK